MHFAEVEGRAVVPVKTYSADGLLEGLACILAFDQVT